jgi:hypothetical protein
MVSLSDVDCILCVLCCVFDAVLFLYIMAQFSVLLCSLSVLLYSLFYCAVNCYLFSCVFLVMYVHLTIHIVL